MTTCEQDPDVVRWGLHLLDNCSLSNFGACSIVTQCDPDLSNSNYIREGYVKEYTNVDSDETIALALQEELSHIAAEEACGVSYAGEEHLQASILSQDWLGPSKRQYNSGHEHELKVADDPIRKMGEANNHSKDEHKNEEISELEFPRSCLSPGEMPFTEEDLSHSLDITDGFALDGEVGKRLDQMVPIAHVPKINGEVPSIDEATTDHQRLIDRLQLYELVELKVEGDGNCQFRALSDQLYRSPEHHKFAREQIVNQLKTHPKMYEGYVPMAYGEYLQKMSKTGEWGDHVTLQAAADTYGVKIFMITSFKDTCYIEILPHIQKSERVIFLSFWAEVHYNSIYPEGDLLKLEPRKKKKWWMF